MKLKNYFEIMGFRAKPKHYPYSIVDFPLSDGRVVHYAQWLHPVESPKSITDSQVEAYRKYLSEGDFCIDVGAHSGDSTLPMAIAAGTTGCALAMEPNPFIYHVLEKNARGNMHVANIHTMMAAASNAECFLEFEYSDSGFCNGGRHENISALKHGHPYKLEVFCVNIMEELESSYAEYLPRLKFIKTDTEGYDLYVLRAMEKVIKQYKPTIKTEVFKDTDREYRQQLFSFFQEMGYQVYKIEEEPIGLGKELTLDQLNDWPHYDVLAVQ